VQPLLFLAALAADYTRRINNHQSAGRCFDHLRELNL
jgi:hypothetical protein